MRLPPNHHRAQRARLLAALKAAGNRGITTIEARTVLDIMHPSGRIKELRQAGYQILTDKSWEATALARHYVARYILISEERGHGKP